MLACTNIYLGRGTSLRAPTFSLFVDVIDDPMDPQWWQPKHSWRIQHFCTWTKGTKSRLHLWSVVKTCLTKKEVYGSWRCKPSKGLLARALPPPNIEVETVPLEHVFRNLKSPNLAHIPFPCPFLDPVEVVRYLGVRSGGVCCKDFFIFFEDF